MRAPHRIRPPGRGFAGLDDERPRLGIGRAYRRYLRGPAVLSLMAGMELISPPVKISAAPFVLDPHRKSPKKAAAHARSEFVRLPIGLEDGAGLVADPKQARKRLDEPAYGRRGIG